MLGLHSILYDKPSFAFNYGSNTAKSTIQRYATWLPEEEMREIISADPRLVRPSVERVEKGLAISLTGLITDRGFDNKTNVRWLEERGIFPGLCPRDPRALREAMKDEDFARMQHRRAQTEARIAIFKNEFLGRPMRSEGFENRALQVAWGVLTHNLWVLAEKLREQRKIREQNLGKAA